MPPRDVGSIGTDSLGEGAGKRSGAAQCWVVAPCRSAAQYWPAEDNLVECDGGFQAGQRCSEAVVSTVAEGQWNGSEAV